MTYKRKIIALIVIVNFLCLYLFTVINVRFGYFWGFSNNPPLPSSLKVSLVINSSERILFVWLLLLIESTVCLYWGFLRFSACFGLVFVLCFTHWIYYCVMFTTPMSANLLQKLAYFVKYLVD